MHPGNRQLTVDKYNMILSLLLRGFVFVFILINLTKRKEKARSGDQQKQKIINNKERGGLG